MDTGYASAENITTAKTDHGITLITPVLLDSSAQARAGLGCGADNFAIDWKHQQVTCPQGQISSAWSPAVQHAKSVTVVKFPGGVCGPYPVREQCTTGRSGYRQLTLNSKQLTETLRTQRAEQAGLDWQADYALRAGVEGAIRQAVAVTGGRCARYRGLDKTRLEHDFAAVALNFHRLDARWNDEFLDRSRTSHLSRLELALAS